MRTLVQRLWLQFGDDSVRLKAGAGGSDSIVSRSTNDGDDRQMTTAVLDAEGHVELDARLTFDKHAR